MGGRHSTSLVPKAWPEVLLEGPLFPQAAKPWAVRVIVLLLRPRKGWASEDWPTPSVLPGD